MEKLTVEKEIWIAAPRERVWQAITTAEQLMKWWSDYWEIEALEPGATIKFGEPGDLMLATVKSVEPLEKFVIRWPAQPQYHNTEIFTIFELEEENGGVRLKVAETGFEALPEDIRQKRFESTATGYEKVLGELKKYVEGKK